jgi:hypothetical protein
VFIEGSWLRYFIQHNGMDHIKKKNQYTYSIFLAQFCLENFKTHVLCSFAILFFLFFSKKIMWKNIAHPERPYITVWRMSIACWVPKTKNIHSEYVILIAFLLQQWQYERASKLRYTYIPYLVITDMVCVYCAVRTWNRNFILRS